MVDTSELIKDERDIASTRLVGCLMANDQLHNMITSSSAKNILAKIYEKTRLRRDMARERKLLKGDRCLFSSLAILELMTPDFFFVAPGILADFFLNLSFMLEKFFKRIWINSNKKIYEYNLVTYYTLRKMENKKKISRA